MYAGYMYAGNLTSVSFAGYICGLLLVHHKVHKHKLSHQINWFADSCIRTVLI